MQGEALRLWRVLWPGLSWEGHKEERASGTTWGGGERGRWRTGKASQRGRVAQHRSEPGVPAALCPQWPRGEWTCLPPDTGRICHVLHSETEPPLALTFMGHGETRVQATVENLTPPPWLPV